ncbi:MAG: DUF971 domain-containing protein [Pirellulales bacterium]|nr:DUF971 domain-containing protein [Pirellulales bacterium]
MSTPDTSSPSAALPVPTDLRRLEDGCIEICWNDGSRHVHSPRKLRDACPCANCREKRSATPEPPLLQVLSPEETRPLSVTGMKPVGQYAYAISFSDGHETGIYLFDYLHDLGRGE